MFPWLRGVNLLGLLVFVAFQISAFYYLTRRPPTCVVHRELHDTTSECPQQPSAQLRLAVVTRAYHGNAQQFHALRFSLRSSALQAGGQVAFFLVATEGSNLTADALRVLQACDTFVVDLPPGAHAVPELACPDFDTLSGVQRASIICGGEKLDPNCYGYFKWVADVPAEQAMVRLQYSRICYPNQMHYRVTDLAVADVLRRCPNCTHIMITNADNFYHQSFVPTLLSAAADMFVCSFFDNNAVPREVIINAALSVGSVDLGAVVVRTAIIKQHGITFLSSLPPLPQPRDYHDADWHWIHRVATLPGLKLNITNHTLFFHL